MRTVVYKIFKHNGETGSGCAASLMCFLLGSCGHVLCVWNANVYANVVNASIE